MIACICNCSQPIASTSRRLLSSSAAVRDQLGASGKSYAQSVRVFDPNNLLEQQNLAPLLFDDLPTRAFREYDKDAERLHYRRLIEWQLPELREKYAQRGLWRPPPSHRVESVRTEWMFEPDWEDASTASITVPLAALPPFSSNAARHKFLLLAGKRYLTPAETICIKGDRLPAFAQNLKWCSDQLDELLREAEIDPDRFLDVPLNPRIRRPPLSVAQFPLEWLPPLARTRRAKARGGARVAKVVEKALPDSTSAMRSDAEPEEIDVSRSTSQPGSNESSNLDT